MAYRINKVGVVGAGTMGSGIAAHLANIGIEVVLLDIVTPGLSEEDNQIPEKRNGLVNELYGRMVKAKPANLARSDRDKFIVLGNVEDDFERLADCDWIIEVIIELLEPKRELMERLDKIRKPGSIISTNTSGIPVGSIAEGRSNDFKAHFLGTHFFNPARYMKLLEIIPTDHTDSAVLDFMVDFGRGVLGKGVVVCKDTPNFIGNRFFAVAASYGLEYALSKGYTVAEIDAITGPLIGRPKTATFRLLDLVGLDIMGHVNNNLYEAITGDPYREVLKPERASAVLRQMVDSGWLGNKSGQGFYKKTFVNGKREFWTLNTETMDYEPSEKVRFDSVGAVRKKENLGDRLPALLDQKEDRATTYIQDTLYYNLGYAAYAAPKIAFRLSDIDDALRWGFGHEAGPFEIWDLLGVRATVEKMEIAGIVVSDWVKEMLGAGCETFYKNGSYYDFESKAYASTPVDKKSLSIDKLVDSGGEIARNMSASLIDMGDGVGLLEMHSPKINSLDPDFFEMAQTALTRLESDLDALVIGNQGQDFCIGANIAVLVMAASQGMWDQIDQMVLDGQKVFYKLHHAPKPVVTAPHQRVLGGGVELAMAGWGSVADHETYMGFVEVGVGLLPAACGCMHMLRRKINPVMRTKNADVLPVMEEVFGQLAMAKVGASAWEDKELGYLENDDVINMNSDHRLVRAKERALALVASGAKPPEEEKIYAAGRDTLAAVRLGVQSFVWANYASEHDLKIGRKIANVLCGGDISGPAWVDPWHILDLEREAFVSLAGEPLTQARITHMLQTGKPLRN